MPSTPNPSQVAVTIQAMFDIGVGTPGAVDNAAQVIQSLNTNQALTIASNIAQTVATVVGVAAAVGVAGTGIVIATTVVAVTITITKNLNDTAPPGALVPPINLGDVWSILGNISAVAGAGLPGGSAVSLGFSIAGGVFGTAGIVENGVQGGISGIVNDFFTAARNLVIRRDPLVLDLDNDGLELIGASGAVLFDHNADGIKTGTGWARPEDGFLVRDLDGNGQIDTGRELFGVDTIKNNSSLATDGFDALRELDSNSDGVITNLDAAYNELKVWRDLNQDGISQANELQSLSTLNITSINTQGSTTGPQAGQTINNNRVAFSSTFTQNGQAKTVGAIDLEVNNFFTEFPPQVVDTTGNPITITTAAQGLPQMAGAGMVRDMRTSASLDGDFAGVLTAFAAATTRDAQRGMPHDSGRVKAQHQPSTRKFCSAMRLQRGWRYAASSSFLRAQSHQYKFCATHTQRKGLLAKAPNLLALHVWRGQGESLEVLV